MMYIDPKDQPAHPDWPTTYQLAWEERKRLRLQQVTTAKEIEKLDTFIELYEKFDGPVKPSNVPSVTFTTTSQTGFSTTIGSSF